MKDPVFMNVENRTTKQKLIKNGLFSSGGWGATVLISFIATPFIVNKLSIQCYGIYALLTGIIGYYNLLDLGLGKGVLKFVAQFNANNDVKAINCSVNSALFVQFIMGMIGSILLVTFSDNLINLLNIAVTYSNDAKISLYFSAFGFLFIMISGTFNSVLMGLQRYDITSMVNVIHNLILNISIVGVLYFGGGLKETIFMTVLSNFILLVVLAALVKISLRCWKFSIRFSTQYLLMLFNFSGFIFITKISSIFTNYIIRFIISFILGPAAVTYYILPTKLIRTIGSMVSSAFSAIFPYASELKAINEKSKIKQLFIKTSKIHSSVMIPFLLTLAIFSKPIMTLWMGEKIADNTWFILSILCFSSVIGSLTTIPNLIATGLGHSKLLSFFSFMTLISYSIFVPLFTKYFGLTGSAYGILISCIPGIFLINYELKNIIILDRLYYLSNVLGFHFIPIIISVFIIIGGGQYLDYNLIITIFLALLFLFLYFGTMLLSGWLNLLKILNFRTGD